MIVARRPSLAGLFLDRGPAAALPNVAARVVVVMALSVGLLWFRHAHPGHAPELSPIPFTLISVVLSIFLGFRNTASYDRWWEGRKLWGQMIVEARSLARDAMLLPKASRERLVHRIVAFGQAMRARLREHAALCTDHLQFEEAGQVACAQNPPGAILRASMAEIAGCAATGAISDIVAIGLATRLGNLSAVQAGCERIANTPLPFSYAVLMHRTAWLFCLLLPFGLAGSLGNATPAVAGLLAAAFLGLDALGEELEAPFGLGANALPLDQMVRQIERDLLESLGWAELPPAIEAVGGVLT